MRELFDEILVRGSRELFADDPGTMTTDNLVPTPNVIDPGDLELFFAGIDEGLVTLERGARFNIADRPRPGGRWGLLSRSADGGWYNAEYLPQIAAYVDAIQNGGYDRGRVLFELPASALQLDVAILDDAGRVVVLGEAKRDNAMLTRLLDTMIDRFGDAEPAIDTKKRGDEARQLAWRLWTVRPDILWLIGPGHRPAWRCSYDPLRLDPLPSLPTAPELGLDGPLTELLPPPDLLED